MSVDLPGQAICSKLLKSFVLKFYTIIVGNYKIKNTKTTKFELWNFFIIFGKYRKFLTHWYIFRLEIFITWLRKFIFKNKNSRFWYPYKIFLRMIFWNFFFSSCSSGLEDSSGLKKIQNIIRYVVVITITKSTVFLNFCFQLIHSNLILGKCLNFFDFFCL